MSANESYAGLYPYGVIDSPAPACILTLENAPMIITTTLECQDLEDIFVQHLAEQSHHFGDIDEYVRSLIYAAFDAHPDFWRCSNPECLEAVYPVMTTRQVSGPAFKRYAVDTRPCEVCPACGTAAP